MGLSFDPSMSTSRTGSSGLSARARASPPFPPCVRTRAHSLSRPGAAEGEPRSIKVSMAKAKPSRWPTLFAAGAASVVETQEKKKDR